MGLDRPIQKAENAAESAISKAKGATLWWLPDGHTCDCGAECEPDIQYVEQQAMSVRVWDCPECEKRYYRERDSW